MHTIDKNDINDNENEKTADNEIHDISIEKIHNNYEEIHDVSIENNNEEIHDIAENMISQSSESVSEVNDTVKIKTRLRPKTVILRILLSLFTFIFIVAGGLLAGVWIIEFGPSEKARDLFVVSMMETSAAKFLATSFLGEAKVKEILDANSVKAVEDISDTNLVVINPGNHQKPNNPENTDNPSQNPSENTNTIPGSDGQAIDPDGDGIDIVDVKGRTYKGKMMIVYDPTRIFVGSSGEYGADKTGKTLMNIYHSYNNVVGAVNGGGWVDINGNGAGGEPLGLVISQGNVLWEQNPGQAYECCGFTSEGKLVVGTFNANQAKNMGITDACTYGPSLIINNNPLEVSGFGSGLNPRTAIGQRADGAVLLLTIDGRRSDSMGGSYVDVQDQMLKFGAVNAYNLDGGSSTTMILNGEYVNTNASIVGYRTMCTAIMIRGQ